MVLRAPAPIIEIAQSLVDSCATQIPSTYLILSPDVNAQPLEQLPPEPVLAPGTPEPPYVVDASNQPLSDEAESIAVPGAAMNTPLTVPVRVRSKLAILVLLNAMVKYCVPVSLLRSGPAGRYPE